MLDERTLEDETCRIVSVRPNPYSGEAITTARADFWVAVEVLIPPDVPTFHLNEGKGDKWREGEDRKGEVLYTRERMAEVMGPRPYMRDYISLMRKSAEFEKSKSK